MNIGMYKGLKESLDQATKQAKSLGKIGIGVSIVGILLMITQIAITFCK